MLKSLIVGFGGFLGAISRYGLSLLLRNVFPHFPFGTFTANVLGCFLVGFLVFAIPEAKSPFPYWRELFVTGFLGALTTMSTFMLETYRILTFQDLIATLLYGMATLVSCFLAVYLGHWLALLCVGKAAW